MSRVRNHYLALVTILALGAPTASPAQNPQPEPPSEPVSAAESPMAPFERLVGGEWQISVLRHRFEWGIGHQTVMARSYDKEGNLASEARWFWHPGEQTIKGYSVDAAGKSFAEMTTHFEGDTMVNALVTVDPEGATATYTGRWVFTDRDHYDWTLFSHGANGAKTEVMQATATRATMAE